ncbi:MAG: nucleotidyltransferase domain-containing protein [ANME-2 cluster archaeon]|nr:nucleotidyltransferase domain-containing protein [ANME-2 cluster archaeon]
MEIISKILDNEPNVLIANLFGSFAKGHQSKHSDLDIAIYLKDPEQLEKDALYPSRLAIKIERALAEKRLVDLSGPQVYLEHPIEPYYTI